MKCHGINRHVLCVGIIAGLGLLGGCAGGEGAGWPSLGQWHDTEGPPPSCAKLESEDQLAINLAQDMANEGRLHAALANLESLPESLPEVRLRKAQVLRQLGQPQAGALYTSLLGTCEGAEGEHGLGQLAAEKGQNAEARAHLLRAVKLAPTDEKIRNDLGVVYLNEHQLDDARFQFLTAMELQQDDHLAAVNLVTLLIYQDNWKQASELVTRLGISPEQFAQAQARADQLKSPKAPAVVAASPAVASVTPPAAPSAGVAP